MLFSLPCARQRWRKPIDPEFFVVEKMVLVFTVTGSPETVTGVQFFPSEDKEEEALIIAPDL